MQPVYFEGATEIGKPKEMTDEQCMSIWAKRGFENLLRLIVAHRFGPPAVYMGDDAEQLSFYLTAWKPSYEDLQALNSGEPVYIKTIADNLPPMAVFTLDENGQSNDAQ